jgi:hypothetical protein
MTFPVGTQISTTNVASSAADPSLARQDIFDLIQAFNQLVASINGNNGVAVLNGTGKIGNSLLPNTFVVNGDIQFQPSSKVVNIRDVLRLAQRFTADNALLTTSTAGDMIYLVDGDAGQPCLGVYDGSDWRVVRLMTQVGDVGAELSSAFVMAAEANA